MRYDFDIVTRGPRRLGPSIAVRFRSADTARAFAAAPEAVRAWLRRAGFRDGPSGSALAPGLFAPADESHRAAVLAELEATLDAMPPVGAGRFDLGRLLVEACRARPDLPVFAAPRGSGALEAAL
ncbi:hypothetical protein [Jannaschia sp. W003]|uniref:hypothetical protein n=1 Tax=Jannaschia sp. W003 TaxID=2867012 RepID=UPI0021A60ED5|nr:hypothetical protein [Jannaschia sp. W003]UWQ21288.1 hypothetical protein K3554_15145 [Jannaschia sp. W003]